ncbi:MAG: FimB/Mfa2 family fimbrial subunit, partial [Tannerellaceae bacterium]|nr:FimB/Mfa2 family fimbrial subunit [Tannerellaceae bacterium]
SACSKAGDPEEGGVTIEKGRLAFILPDAGRAVTYAPGIDAENGADNDVLGIYMFGDDDRFISRTTHTYSEGAQEPGGRKFTVSVTGSGERRFVFVKAPAGYSLPNPVVGSSVTEMAGIVTTAYTGTPPLAAPFVMSNALASGQPYVKVTEVESQTNEINVSLKRRVARFDVIADGIIINNVSITNAAPTGRILDHSNTVNAPLAGINYTIQGSALANTGTSFYLYPTTLGAGSTGTVITVTTAESKTYSITLASDQPIDANKLYRIMVTQSATGSDLTFKLVVADWADADNLPTFEEGSVEAGFNPVVSSSQGVSINDYSVDYSEATGSASAQLFYVSTSNVKPTATVEPLHGTHANAIIVGISDPVAMTYTAGYMSTVTISLPKTTVPVDLEVRLTGNGGDAQTVKVISVPDYTDPRYAITPGLKPVLAGGIYWAPVNVGATELAVSTADTATLAQGGYYFQWGRNTPLAPETDGKKPGAVLTRVAGPVTLDAAENDAAYTNKAIGNASASLAADWLTAPKNDALWTGARAQGPCPDGWRVVTLTDSDPVTKKYGGDGKGAYINATTDKRFRFPGDNPGEYIYFAPRGYYATTVYNAKNGSSWLGSAGTGSNNDINGQFLYLQLNVAVSSYAAGVHRGMAMPVRCVQQ